MATMSLAAPPGKPAPPAAGQPAVRPGAVTAVVCLALAAVVAAVASLNVALPGIARSTHASQTQLAWVIDAYSLVFASLLLPAGAIGDRYGRRRGGARATGRGAAGPWSPGCLISGGGRRGRWQGPPAAELTVLRAVLGL